MTAIAPSWLKWAELPPRKDIYLDRGTTDWGNHDLYPIVEKERTWGVGAYIMFWVTCGGGLSTFAIGSSFMSLGLSAGETVGAVLLGACIASMNTVLLGRVGAVTHLGFVSISYVHLEFDLTMCTIRRCPLGYLLVSVVGTYP
jgi:NCS1 family nucleobase:cation symporter-1